MLVNTPSIHCFYRFFFSELGIFGFEVPDLPPPLFLCALCRGSWSGLAFFKSTLSRGSKMSKLLTSAFFMFSKIKKAPKKPPRYSWVNKKRVPEKARVFFGRSARFFLAEAHAFFSLIKVPKKARGFFFLTH